MWVSAALAAIAFSVSTSIRAEADRAGTAADGLRAMYLATGSVDRAAQGLLWGTGSDHFFDRHYYTLKPRLTYSYPSGDVVVEMMPESAKLDINQASAEDLVRLVTVVSGDTARAQEVAEGIMGWRGGGGGSSNNSASSPFSQPAAPTFQPRGASFEEIEELLLVRGMTPELYYGNYVAEADGRLSPRGGLRDSLSVWGSPGPFDVNGVSPALLQTLGAPPGGIAQLMRRRAQGPIQNLAEVSALGIPTDRLSINAEHLIWNIRATARLRRPDGSPSEVVRSASAIAKLVLPPRNRPRDPIRLRVLRFYEDAWSDFAVAPPGPPSGVLFQ